MDVPAGSRNLLQELPNGRGKWCTANQAAGSGRQIEDRRRGQSDWPCDDPFDSAEPVNNHVNPI